jgi:hypothetical protein
MKRRAEASRLHSGRSMLPGRCGLVSYRADYCVRARGIDDTVGATMIINRCRAEHRHEGGGGDILREGE